MRVVHTCFGFYLLKTQKSPYLLDQETPHTLPSVIRMYCDVAYFSFAPVGVDNDSENANHNVRR